MGAPDQPRPAREPSDAPDRAGRRPARALRHTRLDVARPRRSDLAEPARPAPAALGDQGIPTQDPRPGQNPGSGSKLTPQPARRRAAVLTRPREGPARAKAESARNDKKTPKINNWIHNSPITGFKTHLQNQ